MTIHQQAGKQALNNQLINVAKLVSDYYSLTPDVSVPTQAVSFGTSGHRGCASEYSFNDTHIAAICQALAEYRKKHGVDGPLFLGKDTHALSEPALITAIEVLIANDVEVVIQQHNGYTPTPVISHAIVNYNRDRQQGFADGIVITPSHNPPQDGGIKYNESHGGPAQSSVTALIQTRANEIISADLTIKRLPLSQAMQSPRLHERNFAEQYVAELDQVIDMQAISQSGIKIGTDPLGGSGLHYWDLIAEKYNLDITVVNNQLDQRFAFMSCDKDGKIRMDCSSSYAMNGLVSMKDRFDLAFGNDPDFDRHGIVCKGNGLMNPNHYLAVAVNYLCQHRPQWAASMGIGKTLVSSSMTDRVVAHAKRTLVEMPVGFKWFVEGLGNSSIAFAGEESAGGIFLRKDGSTWATDKDGFILCLLAAEISAVSGFDPEQHYQQLTQQFGTPVYKRIDVAASFEQKQKLASVDVSAINTTQMAGSAITNIQTHAPGNNASIGGIKVSTDNGWFAARPSGTENVYKIYAESFNSEQHLQQIIEEAETLVASVI